MISFWLMTSALRSVPYEEENVIADPTSPAPNSGGVAPTLQFDPEIYDFVLRGVTAAGVQMSAVADAVPTSLPPAGTLGPLDAAWREFHQRYSTEVASSSAALGEMVQLLPVIRDNFEQADRSSIPRHARHFGGRPE
jgi:hypothetical protein